MGEIGIQPDRFLYGLSWWQMKAIIRGYNRRNRQMWNMGRWMTYQLMYVQVGDQMKKNGITEPSDILRLPWDTEGEGMSYDEQKEFLEEVESYGNLKL